MTQTGPSDLGLRLDVKQILSEAQHRWLRPAEICQILTNYQMFHISPEAPDKPVSGSVFLFDRKVLRRFRNDGHNWRKKKDGKIVKEAHEKLKVGSVDMLHCYYAHGEDNENLQRRSYWLLDESRQHIVFVHYLEVKGNKTSISYVRNTDRAVSNSENDIGVSSSFHGTIPSSAQSSPYEDIVSEKSGFHSYPQYPESPSTVDSHSSRSSSYNLVPGPGEISYDLEPRTSFPVQTTLQHSLGGGLLNFHPQTMNHNLALNLHDSQVSGLVEDKSLALDQGDELESYYRAFEQELNSGILQPFLSDTNTGNSINVNLGNSLITSGNENVASKKPVISGLQTDARLQKVDSFTRWMAKELGEGDELDIPSSNRISWSIIGSEYDTTVPAQFQVDSHTLSPSISQDQLFSIVDVYPNWVYSGVEVKVLITGKFLKSGEELPSEFGFSVMFGEVEVPAEVLADGIFCCSAPLHRPGPVPLYVTRSNRVACSEIREFEYRLEPNGDMSSFDESAIVMYIYRRFEMILQLESVASPTSATRNDIEKQRIVKKITSLMEEEKKHDTNLMSENNASQLKLGELLLERQLRQKFYLWLVQMVTENGKGPTMVDEWGQSVLHLAGALGFNWAFQPIIAFGAQIDFRDLKGWTALHWAAFYGREETVAALVALGARPGAVADPCGEYRLGISPADLASRRGHKGISGFLAGISVTAQLSTLTVNDKLDTEVSKVRPVQAISGEDESDTLSHKDSLDAVRHTAEAVARIHQIFRIESFQRKQFIEQASDEIPDDEKAALSLVASKSSRYGTADRVSNAAAVRIQKKYRGWKKRKEFLLIRQKVVKIQAHVRGHQVRKKYKHMYLTLGVMQAALRWRHKMSGLPEFRSIKGSASTQKDDDDIVKQGRKQIEARMQNALARVKSMAQNPEARAQYRRLLTAAEGFKEPKEEHASSDIFSYNLDDLALPDNLEDLNFPVDDDMLDFSSLLDDDDTLMSSFQ